MSGSGISWAICKSAPRSRQITTPAPHHSVFTGRMPFLPPNQQRQSTEGITPTLTLTFNHNPNHGAYVRNLGDGGGANVRSRRSKIERTPPANRIDFRSGRRRRWRGRNGLCTNRHLSGRVGVYVDRAWNCCGQTCCRTRPAVGRQRSASTISPPAQSTHIAAAVVRI